tara:strand:+ start:2985 stop:3230 length:246 start_codon:yes stop_codon:yes gene_type:complete
MQAEDLFRPLEPHALKPLLEKHNIRQAQAADKLGVSLAYLNMILNGHTRPSQELDDAMDELVEKMSPMEPILSGQNGDGSA